MKQTRYLLLIIGLTFFTPLSQAAAVFSDVASSHPYYESISALHESGVVEGYENNTFRPERPVNRAEALKIILLGSDILVPEIQPRDIFPDVIHGTWYAKFVSKAKNLGIVSGDSTTGLFRPGDTVNLAEILKILLRTNDIHPDTPDTNPYLDVPRDTWFAPYFGYAQSISLLDETNGNVNPSMEVNRGLMAELMYRLSQKPKGYSEGQASYYGEKFHGKTTASGEVFDASAFTAAHRSFPFGTWLKVINLENYEEVLVRVNDRGPYAGENRIIDLSKAAFESISPLSRGVIDVAVTPVPPPEKPKLPDAEKDLPKLPGSTAQKGPDCPGSDRLRFIEKTAFDNILLDDEVPETLLENEALILSGTTKSDVSSVSAFIVDSEGKQSPIYGKVEDKRFELNLSPLPAGTYKLGLLQGEAGSSVVRNLTVAPADCLSQSADPALRSPGPTMLKTEEGDTVIRWEKGGYNFFKISFSQAGREKRFILKDRDTFRPDYRAFEGFREGPVQLRLQGAGVTGKSILETDFITWSAADSLSFQAGLHHQYVVESGGIADLSLPESVSAGKSFTIRFDPKKNVRAEGALILPDGSVKEIPLKSPSHEAAPNNNDISVFPSAAQEVSLTYTPTAEGVHFVEFNDAEGLAMINLPLYPAGEFPLLPNPIDLTDREPVDLGNDLNKLRNDLLSLVNKDRSDHGLSPLNLDSQLTQLAQYRADDLTENNYFSHWNKDGLNVNDLRKNYAINQQVSENLAKEVNLELAQYGLMRSALHRSNILSEEWKRVGFGVSKARDGSYIAVQVFSDDPIDLADLSQIRDDILKSVNAQRGKALTLKNNLNQLAQDWSARMAAEDFFDFSAPNGESLVDVIRGSGVNASLGTHIIGNTSFDDAKKQIAENAQLLESRWNNLGLGIVQDTLGIIKITLIYTE